MATKRLKDHWDLLCAPWDRADMVHGGAHPLGAVVAVDHHIDIFARDDVGSLSGLLRIEDYYLTNTRGRALAVVVRPDMRRRGIATMLMGAALRYAMDTGMVGFPPPPSAELAAAASAAGLTDGGRALAELFAAGAVPTLDDPVPYFDSLGDT